VSASGIILAENLTRVFGGGKLPLVTAVDHLNVEVAEGEIFALV